MNRADRCTFATTGALVVVNDRQVIHNLDGTLGTVLLALATADTAVGAILAGNTALVVVGAFHHNSGSVLDEVDYSIGAFTGADAAADAFSGIDPCHAVFDSDGVLGADSYAVAVAKAGEGAVAIAGITHIGGSAGLVTLIVIFLCNNIAGSVAGKVCNLLHNVGSLNTEDDCDILGGSVTAGNTAVGLVGFSFRQSFCITVAAGITASAAVGAGETVANGKHLLVLLD